MTHTKNILKSLLITVMALSLLAVSCKKDENGGGGKTPTNPTSVTINASTLDAAIKAAGTAAKLTGVTIDFSSFQSTSGNANLEAKISEEVTLDTLRTELEKALTFSSSGATATATAKVPTDNTGKEDATVTVVIDAGNNTFADDVNTSYTVADKKATVVITITPDKKWNNT